MASQILLLSSPFFIFSLLAHASFLSSFAYSASTGAEVANGRKEAEALLEWKVSLDNHSQPILSFGLGTALAAGSESVATGLERDLQVILHHDLHPDLQHVYLGMCGSERTFRLAAAVGNLCVEIGFQGIYTQLGAASSDCSLLFTSMIQVLANEDAYALMDLRSSRPLPIRVGKGLNFESERSGLVKDKYVNCQPLATIKVGSEVESEQLVDMGLVHGLASVMCVRFRSSAMYSLGEKHPFRRLRTSTQGSSLNCQGPSLQNQLVNVEGLVEWQRWFGY
uniref:Uncharacterized protein n=1 Tax=Salix viminalis TaxID=40686 RepID=A0A6N2LRN4_SALVM